MTRNNSENLSGRPIVVKLGGSLFDQVPDLVPVLLASRKPLFIVPGGGIFADAIRNCRADNDSAHWMAIAAMDQFGWYIASQGITSTTHLKVPDRPVVFLPYFSMHQYDPLPHTWDVTSDSIAAWIAAQAGLDLLLLKSVDGIMKDNKVVNLVKKPIQTDVVDPFFIPFVLKRRIATTILNGSRFDRIEKFLNGEPVAGTRIGTTF
jgi:5-(aminomethyl)-3-furanmethanol phosphate kinase